jgi:hypothetical protein
MSKQPEKRKSILSTWAWYGLILLIAGPFAILYGLAFLGFDSPRLASEIPAFGIWFMSALSVCGLITLVTMLVEGLRNRRIEWGCLVIVAVATAWWLWVLWKELK